ncbi:MAG: TrkA family potassium uptake protein [Lentisphaeria bacterium]|nr:TrkA family potassium uptake protein [Lentisphaeria bacterium]
MDKNKQITIIGVGTFGLEIALSLMRSGVTVCAIDSDPEIIDLIREQVSLAMVMDATQKQALLEAEIQEVDTVVVAIGAGSLENSILTTALLKEVGVENIIARATSELHERILRQVGASMIVNPEREMGVRVAKHIVRPGFMEMISLPGGACIAQIPLPDGFAEHTLEELGVRKRFNLNVLGIQRPKKAQAESEGQQLLSLDSKALWNYKKNLGVAGVAEDSRVIMNISPTQDRFKSGDILLVMGKEDDINKLFNT